MDERGPWNDLVGVFSKKKYSKKSSGTSFSESLAKDCLFKGPPWPPKEHEVTSGVLPYMQTLDFIHKALQPKNYLEIGVRTGKSLALASCPAIGVDPLPEIQVNLPNTSEIIQLGSDEFFTETETVFDDEPIDFAFIDGMHWIEYALRDFMNIEKQSHDGTMVVIDDIFPNHEAQARRKRETVFWTGDVWKLYDILAEYRPDLILIPLDTEPTGLLLIVGLDKNNRVLWENYNPILSRFKEMHPPPPARIKRLNAISPESGNLKNIFQIIKVARKNKIPLSIKSNQIKTLLPS